MPTTVRITRKKPKAKAYCFLRVTYSTKGFFFFSFCMHSMTLPIPIDIG